MITPAPRAAREQPPGRILVTGLLCDPSRRAEPWCSSRRVPADPARRTGRPWGAAFAAYRGGAGARRARDVHGGCRELPAAGEVRQPRGQRHGALGPGRGGWRGRVERGGGGGPTLRAGAPREGPARGPGSVTAPTAPAGRSSRRSCAGSPPACPPCCRAPSRAPRPWMGCRGCTSRWPPPSTPASECPCVSRVFREAKPYLPNQKEKKGVG